MTVNLNWHAKCYLNTAICGAIAQMEKEIKSLGQLTSGDVKLNPDSMNYFMGQILELIQACDQLRKFQKGEPE